MFTKGVLRRSGSDVPGLRRWDNRNPDEASPSKEVPMEPAELLAYKRRLSVRDLANKFESDLASTFEKNQTANQQGHREEPVSAKANIEERKAKNVRDIGVFEKGLRDTVVSDKVGKDAGLSDKEIQFGKLNRSLNDLQGRVGGRSKIDVEEALKAAKLLSLIFARQETELAQERAEIKKMSLLERKSSDDAKRMVEEIQTRAQTEIKAVEEEIGKVQSAFDEYKQRWTVFNLTELEELKRSAQEAERIKRLHESSNTRAMEDQIMGLRQQLAEKNAEIVRLHDQLEAFHRQGQKVGKLQWYQLVGREHLGTTLSIGPVDGKVSDVSHCQIQWYRISPDGSADHIISGATRPQYAPEPFDVGSFLRAHITLPSGKIESLQTVGPIDAAVGLDNFVEILFKKGSAQFGVRIVVKNGEIIGKQSLHTLYVNKYRLKLKRNHSGVAKENYSPSMQLCGSRGGGESSAQGLFWVPKKGVVFTLVMESERERNAAILLARKFAKLNKIQLRGPDDIITQSMNDET